MQLHVVRCQLIDGVTYAPGLCLDRPSQMRLADLDNGELSRLTYHSRSFPCSGNAIEKYGDICCNVAWCPF